MWWLVGTIVVGFCSWRAGLVLGLKGASGLVKRGTSAADDLKRYADKRGWK